MLLDALRQLWPVAAALALLDAVAWVRAGRRLLVSWLGGRWAVRRPGPSFAGVLPASREAASGLPVVLPTVAGVYLLPLRDADGPARFSPASWAFEPWTADLALDAEGGELQVGGHRRELGSAGEAKAQLALLGELRGLSPKQRKAASAAAAARALDLERAAGRRRAFEAAVAPAVVWAWLFFAALFGVLPAAVYLVPQPPGPAVAAVLALAVVTYGAALATALRAARRLRREEVLPAGGALAPLLLAPPAAVRAVASLGRDLYHGCDLLAAAAVLLPRAALLRLARTELHGAAAAARPEAGGGDDWRSAWSERHRLILALLRQAGVEEAEALAPPPRRDPAAAAWCPFCDVEVQGGIRGEPEGEIREGAAGCPDCSLPLLQYPPAA